MSPLVVISISTVATIFLAKKFAPTIGRLLLVGLFGHPEKRQARKAKREREYQQQLQQYAMNNGYGNDYVRSNTLTPVKFTSISNGTEKTVNLEEDRTFDFGKDVLFRGTLKVRDANDNYEEEDIYLFQPRLYAANDILVGPKFYKNNHMADDLCYLIKDEKNEVYKGYTPKREVVTGMQFDYVNSSKHVENYEMEGFINIDVPQDNYGNYIPVDLTNPEEAARFEKYVHRSASFNWVDYYNNKYANARKSCLEYLRKMKQDQQAVLASINAQNSEQKAIENDALKVEKSREANENVYKFYDRYNYWRPAMFGTPGYPTAHLHDIDGFPPMPGPHGPHHHH